MSSRTPAAVICAISSPISASRRSLGRHCVLEDTDPVPVWSAVLPSTKTVKVMVERFATFTAAVAGAWPPNWVTGAAPAALRRHALSQPAIAGASREIGSPPQPAG